MTNESNNITARARKLPLLTSGGRVAVTARESGRDGEWHLDWQSPMEPGLAGHMFRNARNILLPMGATAITLNCTDDAAVKALVDRWPDDAKSATGDLYRLDLIYPEEDGLIHEDIDDRIPLSRITCITCVERIGDIRSYKRQQCMGGRSTPQEVAVRTGELSDVYRRLAELEGGPSDEGQKQTPAESTREMEVLHDSEGFLAKVVRTEDAATWALEWNQSPDSRRAYQMFRNAERRVLQADGEYLKVQCPDTEHGVRQGLAKYHKQDVKEDGDSFLIQLIDPSEEEVHEDFDNRTPLHRITCPTCVERIARSRTRDRTQAISNKADSSAIAHASWRIAAAYHRLAEIEDALDLQKIDRQLRETRAMEEQPGPQTTATAEG